MPKLQVTLSNCYGIRNLNHSFDLGRNEDRGGAFSIYAPNGVMKSSFARTFSDYAQGNPSKDLIFPSRETIREIKWDEEDIDPKSIFVIKPYIESYESQSLSTLIANPSLQKKYATSIKSLNEKRKKLTEILKTVSGLTSRTETVVQVLLKDLEASEENFVEKIEALIGKNLEVEHLEGIKYSEVINSKTLAILKKKDFQSQLEEYVGLYNTLVEESPILNRSFNHQGATSAAKGLKDAGFYTAGHTVTLKVGDSAKVVSTSQELDEVFQQERDRILSDSDLKKRFEAVDKSLGNIDTKKLRSLIETNKDLLADLNNIPLLKEKFWYAYLIKNKPEMEDFAQCSLDTKQVLSELVASAKTEETKWQKVIEVFNRRFDVPFNVSLKNQADVILKDEKPVKSFSFIDTEEASEIKESTILSVLSQGERRALYILNLLFEVETRKDSGQKIIFIIDDIADSFDYRNKYAIIEYLKELSLNQQFSLLFLTHNFDFHRTISGRLNLHRKKRLIASKEADSIILREEKYQNDIFSYWKDQMSKNERMFLSCIPFVRNLAEYSGLDDVSNSLTETLHLKSNSRSKTYGDLFSDYKKTLRNLTNIPYNEDTLVLDRIHGIASEIASEQKHHVELEEKVILSIAIRLIAEEYMLKRLDNPEWEEPSSNQTRALFEDFTGNFGSEDLVIATLDQVNLMTPENIHLNSFMFEPILDISPGHLYKLYENLMKLSSEEQNN